MLSKLIVVLLVIVGLINFGPVLGAISAQKLSQAYDIEMLGKDIAILMRHRALLFGILGGFILYSAFVPAYQNIAMLLAGISMFGYLFFMWHEGGYNAALHKVMVIDIVGIVCLLSAAALKFFASPSP